MLTFNRLRFDAGDGSPVVDYRIESGRVERRVLDVPIGLASKGNWRQLTPEELTASVMENRVLARWLTRRMGVFRVVEACNPGSSSINQIAEEHPHEMAA